MTVKEVKNTIADAMRDWYELAFLNLYEYYDDRVTFPFSILEKTPLFNDIYADSKKYGVDQSIENHKDEIIKWGKTAVKEYPFEKLSELAKKEKEEETIPISWLKDKRNSPECKNLPELKQAIDLVLASWIADIQRNNAEFVVDTPPLEEKETEERDL